MSEKTDKVSFEDALDMTGFGRFNLIMMLLTSSMIMAMAFETFSVAYLVPASACELQTSSVNQGMMAGMPLLGILVASNIWGYLADTRGRRKILAVSLTLGFLTGASATFSPNWIVFCVLKFLSSSAMAGTFGLAITFLSECTPEKRRFTLLLLITSVFLSSAGSMAALTIPILPLKFSYYIPYLNIHFNSWRLLNIVYSLPSLIGAIGSIFAYESPKFFLSIGEQEKALEVLRKIFIINSGKDGDCYQVKQVTLDEASASQTTKGIWSSIVSQTTPLLKPPLLKNTVLLSVLFVAVYFWYYALFLYVAAGYRYYVDHGLNCNFIYNLNPYTVWLPYMVDGFMKSLEKGDVDLSFCEMLRSSQNVTMDQVTDCTLNRTAMTMVFGMDLFLAALNVVLAGLQPYLGRKNLLIGIQLVSGTAALCLNASTSWPLTAVLMITFIAGVLNFGYLSTFSVDVFPTYVKAMGVCLTLMVGRGSAVLGINLLKDLLDHHCETSFYIFGGLTVFGGFVGFLLPEKKQRAAESKCEET